ncbi:MAG: hypothetical protein HOB98_06010 [Gammaproteobacteria bacterium]|nr:hypothetical protein [Gammaproteobacteria bacterium]MBT3869657.1 hypothetical protein [Gammaproteobacteria bacterium]MBT4379598.1 hypothetical protein [Gammaproteobacteria bacterium]MBT4615990.1 hypothetical protein [Gammaproteobacteria bacterium]MBT5196966.1 hypothetical protein [Gammaproteobacteria bacterium]
MSSPSPRVILTRELDKSARRQAKNKFNLSDTIDGNISVAVMTTGNIVDQL